MNVIVNTATLAGVASLLAATLATLATLATPTLRRTFPVRPTVTTRSVTSIGLAPIHLPVGLATKIYKNTNPIYEVTSRKYHPTTNFQGRLIEN